MSIVFHKTFIHLLDTSLDIPILSTKPLVLSDETEAFITSYLVNLFENHGVTRGTFTADSPYLTSFSKGIEDFYTFSCELAQHLFTFMLDTPSIPCGDLLVCQFDRDGEPYVGIIKLNYKEAFTHLANQEEDGNVNTLIKHKSIFPDTASKLQEAIIIHQDTLECIILNALKQKYLHDFFGVGPSLTIKEKIKVVEHVVTEAIEENFENKLEALSFAKNNIAKSIDHSHSIELDTILEETFGEHAELIETCLSECEKYGLNEKKIDLPRSEKVSKKYTSHKIKTNTGIELKLPTEMMNDINCIEFITNPDGTISILIKNIAQLINK